MKKNKTGNSPQIVEKNIKTQKEKKPIVTTTLEKDQRDHLNTMAKENGMSRSQVLRKLIADHISLVANHHNMAFCLERIREHVNNIGSKIDKEDIQVILQDIQDMGILLLSDTLDHEEEDD